MDHVAIVCHDAGGAEIISSWLNRAKCTASVVVAGPAEAIFKRKCPHAEFLPLVNAIVKSTWILCGTGWQSSFERRAIALGLALGKKTVAFLDHWVNYRERFEEEGRVLLPDEIWVGDVNAQHIARSLFHHTPIILKSNPYFEDMLSEITRARPVKYESNSKRVLYLGEPIASHGLMAIQNERHLGYTESDALEFFLENIDLLGQPIESITIRPHPSEILDKYKWVYGRIVTPIHFGGLNTLAEEILVSDIVVGCETTAMVIALLAGKRVISCIPPGGHICRLPHRGIEHMQNLVRGFAQNG
jgi:hypothetical protein